MVRINPTWRNKQKPEITGETLVIRASDITPDEAHTFSQPVRIVDDIGYDGHHVMPPKINISAPRIEVAVSLPDSSPNKSFRYNLTADENISVTGNTSKASIDAVAGGNISIESAGEDSSFYAPSGSIHLGKKGTDGNFVGAPIRANTTLQARHIKAGDIESCVFPSLTATETLEIGSTHPNACRPIEIKAPNIIANEIGPYVRLTTQNLTCNAIYERPEGVYDFSEHTTVIASKNLKVGAIEGSPNVIVGGEFNCEEIDPKANIRILPPGANVGGVLFSSYTEDGLSHSTRPWSPPTPQQNTDKSNQILSKRTGPKNSL